MTPSLPRPETQPPAHHGRRALRLLIIWVVLLVIDVAIHEIEPWLRAHHVSTGFLSFLAFCATFVCVAIVLYAIAVAARWMLRRLFWRVGRRLFLSYFMIGVFPFFLFAILLLTILY